jgi:hypothetical protein
VPSQAIPTTVREDAGINSAANKGESAPDAATEKPMALYTREAVKQTFTTRILFFASFRKTGR